MVLFRKRKTEEWHHQVNLMTGDLPTSLKFPWLALRLPTDAYIKKKGKGKLNQSEIDILLSTLINNHEARDIAIAACAHAMSPASVRALLNVELNVAPRTYYGLNLYLTSLVAANYCNPQSISALEARWARELLPYATHGTCAAGRLLEGVCKLLREGTVMSLNALPDFAILTRKAIVDFTSQLDGFKIKCQWVTAHASVMWLAKLLEDPTPRSRSRSPEQLLDSQFPNWRVWAAWKPDLDRLKLFEGLDSNRRAVLPDILSLEGPDFMAARHPTLKDGLLAQYAGTTNRIRLKGLNMEVKTATIDELRGMLDRTLVSLQIACGAGEDAVALFIHLCVGRTITQEALQVLAGVAEIPAPQTCPLHAAVLQVYSSGHNLTIKDVNAISCLLPILNDSRGDLLRGALNSYMVHGIHLCIQYMQDALQAHIAAGDSWYAEAKTLHQFGQQVRDAECFHPFLLSTVYATLQIWPSASAVMQLIDIHAHVKMDLPSFASSTYLEGALKSHCMDRLIRRGMIELSESSVILELLPLWDRTPSDEKRLLALLVANESSLGVELRLPLLREIPALPGDFVQRFLFLMGQYTERNSWAEGEESCIMMAELLATSDVSDCWRWLFLPMIEQHSTTLLGFSLAHLRAEEWLKWMSNLRKIFNDIIFPTYLSNSDVLEPGLHLWCEQLTEYLPTVKRLETALGTNAPAIHYILRGGGALWLEDLHMILNILTQNRDQPYEALLQTTTGLISRDDNNIVLVAQTLSFLNATSAVGGDACQAIYDSYQKTSKLVTEVVVTGWLNDTELQAHDKSAIRALASVLGLEADEEGVPDGKLKAAADYLEKQATKILEEAVRLQGIQRALKVKDPQGTRALLESIGVVDTSALEEELERLPAGLIGSIEQCGENEVEMTFPLTHFTDLQRTAMGIGAAQSMLIRLVINYDEMPTGFCVHLDNEPDREEVDQHYPWVAYKDDSEPEKTYCIGRSSLMTWRMSRALCRHLKQGFTSLEDVHRFVTARIKDLAISCVVCGLHHSAQSARRPIPCTMAACSRVWNRISTDIRLTEIRSDPAAVDLLLTGVYAAAATARTDLLPTCPISLSKIQAILDTLPSISTLQTSPDLRQALRSYHTTAELLLTWACTSYRGFLASATGILRIPGLPQGTIQFMLASASPELESAFATKLRSLNPGNKPTRILFHGTSLDRLPAILIKGLKICSGTALQRTGAAHGTGIYMAEEPATSFGYSPAGTSWRGSGLQNMRVLLGCEVAGSGNCVSPGIHVIKDESMVMVRYMFLFRSDGVAPVAGHVVPAMVSAIGSLRSRAV